MRFKRSISTRDHLILKQLALVRRKHFMVYRMTVTLNEAEYAALSTEAA
jgi:hypothetical protein